MFCTLCVYTTSWQHSCSLRLSLSLSLSLCLSPLPPQANSSSHGNSTMVWNSSFPTQPSSKTINPGTGEFLEGPMNFTWFQICGIFFPQIKFKLHLIPRTHSIPVRRYSNVWMNHLHVQKVKKAFVCPLLPGIQKLDEHVKYSFSSNKINLGTVLIHRLIPDSTYQ